MGSKVIIKPNNNKTTNYDFIGEFTFQNVQLNNTLLSVEIKLDQKDSKTHGEMIIRNDKGKVAVDFHKTSARVRGKGVVKDFDVAPLENVLVRNSHLNITGIYNGKFNFEYMILI